VQIHELARGVNFKNRGAVAVMDVAYVDGQRKAHFAINNMSTVDSSAVPTDLLAKHGWDDAAFPSFEDEGSVNALLQCGVKGDGSTDDVTALQACVDEHDVVFLPKVSVFAQFAQCVVLYCYGTVSHVICTYSMLSYHLHSQHALTSAPVIRSLLLQGFYRLSILCSLSILTILIILPQGLYRL
jgi:hypothetical protein